MTAVQTLCISNYNFTLYPDRTHFNRVAGVYLFLTLPRAELTENLYESFYCLLYAGITNDLQFRMGSHHRIEAARELGMTHTGILKKSSLRQRKSIERALIMEFNPVLNRVYQY